MTNSERLRAMSDQELAAEFCDLYTNCYDCPGEDYCRYGKGKGNGLLKWLESEYVEE